MIVPMKKLTLLVSERERENLISALGKAGVVHIKPVKPPKAHDITFLEDKILNLERMMTILRPYASSGKQQKKCSAVSILEDAERIEELYRERRSLKSAIDELNLKIRWFDRWGRFDPESLSALRGKGVDIRLCRIKKDEFPKLKKLQHKVLSREKGYFYLAVVLPGGEELPVQEVIPPPKSVALLKEERGELGEKMDRIDIFLKEEAEALDSLKECRQGLEKELKFLNVKFGMKEEEGFAYLQGFSPAADLDKVTSVAKEYGAGYLAEEPDNPEETPTLIRTPKWLRIIDPVFKFMNTIPGYEEFDISFYFLVFFSLFFAMLVGDAGYGILFLVTTFLARQKFRKVNWEPFFLMYLLSAATIVWGVITGTWFGAERIQEVPLLHRLVIPQINSFSDTNQNFMIYICFIIGAVQLTIAHTLRALRVINSIKALAQVGWILVLWGMFFAAGKFVIARPFPQEAGWLLVAGIVTVLFTSNPGKGILKGALATLAELPLNVISSFSDIVSYLRLFAVGYAAVVVAQSFNDMALAGGIHGVIGGIAAAAILFFGHALNIILAFMAVIVHGIRLNMLEFSGHLGMQWSGKKYEPYVE